jgi:diguanylate cyclase (GGDEF)-like protein
LNDRYGHEAGDRMLAAVADKMRMVLPPDTFCARLGGDEFIAVLQGTDLVPHQLLLVGRRLCDAIQTPVVGGDATLEVGASIGIALGQLPGDLTDLMQNADRAMYEAKRSGSGVRLWQAESEDLLKSA